jgi:hypothetical protein
MSDAPYDAGIKKPVNTTTNPASSGFVRTNPYSQTIRSGAVDKLAQDYQGPEDESESLNEQRQVNKG